MRNEAQNKYRAAMEVLQRGREMLVESMADDIVDQGADLLEGGYQFNEFLEAQGTRLHFLCLLMGQLELSAEALDEANAPPPPPPKKRPRSRPRRLQQRAPSEGSPDDL